MNGEEYILHRAEEQYQQVMDFLKQYDLEEEYRLFVEQQERKERKKNGQREEHSIY